MPISISVRRVSVGRCTVSPRPIPASRALVDSSLEDTTVLWSVPAARALVDLSLEMRAIVRSVATSRALVYLPLESRSLIVLSVPATGSVIHLPLKRTVVHGSRAESRVRSAAIPASWAVIAVSLVYRVVHRARTVTVSIAAVGALIMSALEDRTVQLPIHGSVRGVWR